MKRITGVILLLLAIIYTQSCKKEQSKMQDNSITNSKTQMLRTEDDNTESKIIKFFERMRFVRENPNYEGAESWNYTKDSTIWYIESALNYKYAFRWQYSGNTEHSDMYNIDSSFISVSANSNGDFNIIALQTSFDAFEASLKAQYASIENDNKFFVISDILDRGFDNNKLELKQFSVIGKADITFPSFGWVWGLNYGNCMFSILGIDAADIMENNLSGSRPNLTSPTGVYYYDDIDILHLGTDGYIIPMAVGIPANQNPTAFSNFKLFRNPYSAGDVCLSVADINWYTNNTLTIENSYAPIGKQIVFNDVIDERYRTSLNSPPIYNRHKLQPHYGVLKFRARTTPID